MARITREVLKARNHFEVLQLPLRHLGCQEIRSSYLSLAKQVHPDQCDETEAAKAFQKVTAAYQVLRCPERRTRYLEVERDRERRDPHKNLEFFESIAKPWVLYAAVGLFFCAESVRLTFGTYSALPEDDLLIPCSSKPTSTPLAPAFSANPGEPLVGHSSQELTEKLKKARRRHHTTSASD